MPRLARLTLNALTVVSLLLCVAVTLLWVRSYHRMDRLLEDRWTGETGPAGGACFVLRTHGFVSLRGRLGWSLAVDRFDGADGNDLCFRVRTNPQHAAWRHRAWPAPLTTKELLVPTSADRFGFRFARDEQRTNGWSTWTHRYTSASSPIGRS